MLDLIFQEHTEEKLDALNYYYNIWFKIVKDQRTFIIDTNAGTGYNVIGKRKKKVLGSALLAVALFKKDTKKKLKLILIDINKNHIKLLRDNILNYISKNNIDAKLDEDILINFGDWSSILTDILHLTKNSIRLFFLDPAGFKSLPWNKLLPLIKKGKSEFGYKESGIEILINWAWHAIRRQIGDYYKCRETYAESTKNAFQKEYINLDLFFGPVNWKKIADKYPKNIFEDELDDKIENLREELIKAYVINFFEYFKYVIIHPVYSRKKIKDKNFKERGKVKYYLIFASNYHEAPNIIDIKFKEYRDIKVFYSLPKSQKTLDDFISIKIKNKKLKKIKNIRFPDKIKNLEIDLGTNLYSINKKIIKYLYDRKNYDYGCFEFKLFEKFQINEDHYSIRFLLDNNIINIRKKKAKSDYQGRYYYLSHPRLVDRREYLFFDGKVFIIENGKILLYIKPRNINNERFF